jgi:hypothetical protein
LARATAPPRSWVNARAKTRDELRVQPSSDVVAMHRLPLDDFAALHGTAAHDFATLQMGGGGGGGGLGGGDEWLSGRSSVGMVGLVGPWHAAEDAGALLPTSDRDPSTPIGMSGGWLSTSHALLPMDGATALGLAAQRGQSDVLVGLLKAKADARVQMGAQARPSTEPGTTFPSGLALMLSRARCVAAQGMTPLMLAAQYGSEDCVRRLLEQEKTLYLDADVSGRDALMVACLYGQDGVARMLLDHCVALDSSRRPSILPNGEGVRGKSNQRVVELLDRRYA